MPRPYLLPLGALILLITSFGCGPRAPVAEAPRRNSEQDLAVSQSAPARPVPTSSPTVSLRDERIAAIAQDNEREIAELESALERLPKRERELDARIANLSQRTASLNIEAELERATQSDHLQILQSRQEWQDARLRERLAASAEMLRAEENAFAQIQNQFSMLVAPAESDLIRQGRANFAVQEQRVVAARAEYRSMLARYQVAPEGYVADQSSRLENNRVRLREMGRLLVTLRGDLTEALAERERIAAERAAGETQLAELRARGEEREVPGSAQK